MPKQLINLIGVLVSVAILALGVFLVAVPLVTQAISTNASADQIDRTNVVYQAQIDSLTKAKENKSETDAAVAALREQIPATPKLDDVFALVAQASQSSGASITSVTAGTPANFAARTVASSLGDQKAAPTPTPSPSASAGGVVGDAQQTAGQANAQTDATNQATGAAGGVAGGTSSTSTRTQIDFAITVTATDMNQVTAFLDALRAGPRLLANITSTVAQNGTGIQASITALTFVDGAPVATGASK